MPLWAVTLLLLAVSAGFLAFLEVASATAGLGLVLYLVLLILSLLTLALSFMRG